MCQSLLPPNRAEISQAIPDLGLCILSYSAMGGEEGELGKEKEEKSVFFGHCTLHYDAAMPLYTAKQRYLPCVDENEICPIDALCRAVSILEEDRTHDLAITDVHLAPVRLNKILQVAVRGVRGLCERRRSAVLLLIGLVHEI